MLAGERVPDSEVQVEIFGLCDFLHPFAVHPLPFDFLVYLTLL